MTAESKSDTQSLFREKARAMNEALLLGSLRQHELTEAADNLNAQLVAEIAERQLAEAALRESEELFRTLFDSAPMAVFVCDRNAVIQQHNQRAAELWGREPVCGTEQHCGSVKLWRPDGTVLPHAQSPIVEVLRTGVRAFGVEVFIERTDGSRLPVLANFAALKNAQGEITGAITSFIDITERKRAEQELVAAKDEISRHAQLLEETVTERTGQLRGTIKELEAFSYSVSHDMRAPLRAMQSYAQFLTDEYSSKLDEKGANYLQQIMRSAVRLDRLIQDVLSYTRILHSPLPMESVDLDRLVRDIVETYPNGQPIKPQIHIVGKLPRVIGNEALLTQCVSNLLGNGAKFVSPGTIPQLEISAEAMEGSMVRVWFKDNGIGIAPENRERIFRLFERIHPDADYDGTGIGLTIVHKAIERMGAQIGFESEPSQGTQFWIQLKKG
jgi:PAS domain S-box-containing protein